MLSLKKQKRSKRVRFKLKKYNKNSMRLTVYKSSKYLYAQIIDDKNSVTICSASSLKSEKNKNACNIETAKRIGSEIAKLAKEKGVKHLYLDRGPNLYHGIIRSITDEVRSEGLDL
tara:strand:+ start:652 stop:999 length:348 start_codon:yes stop_codon:yes gene_type:complete